MSKDKKVDNIKDLTRETLKRMKIGGLQPMGRTIAIKLYSGGLLGFIIATNILQGVYLLTHDYSSGGIVMIDACMFFGYWQLIMKMYTLITKNEILRKLININNHEFYSVDDMAENQKMKVQQIYNIVGRSVRLYKILILSALAGHYTSSLARGRPIFIMNIWLPKSYEHVFYTTPGYEIVCAVQCILMWICITAGLIETDCTFMLTLASALAQIKMLKIKLAELRHEVNVKRLKDKLVDVIKHHNLVLHYLSGVEDMFNQEMLIVLVSNMLLAVIAAFSILTERNISQLITYVAFLVSVTFQIFIFCFLGQLVQDESISVAHAAYQSNWESIPDRNIRVMLILIILRSQKYFNLTMGRFFKMCLETFTQIAKLMMSFFTFMLNFK